MNVGLVLEDGTRVDAEGLEDFRFSEGEALEVLQGELRARLSQAKQLLESSELSCQARR